MEKNMILIDGNSLINRAYYAIPSLQTKKGLYTNGIYGFTTMLLKAMENYSPDYIGVAFDLKKPTFRHKEYKEYKAGRKKMPTELREQIQPLKRLLDALGIYRIELEGYEADDLIGTVSKIAEKNNINTYIITGDKDALQLASDKTKIIYTKRGISDIDVYDEKYLLEKENVTPKEFIDLKGLMGDKSDNIPGVPGVGEKTAKKLIEEFNSIENLLLNIGDIKAKKLKENIENNKDQLLLSKRLVTIIRELPIELNIEDLRLKSVDTKYIIELFNELEFSSLLKKVMDSEYINNKQFKPIESKKTNTYYLNNISDINQIKGLDIDSKEIYLKIIPKSSDILSNDNIFKIGLRIDDDIFILNINDFKSEALAFIKNMTESNNIKIIGHNLKDELILFESENIDICNKIYFDTMIGEYLLNPNKSNYDISSGFLEYTGKELISEEDLLGKGKSLKEYSDLDQDILNDYIINYLKFLPEFKDEIYKQLKESELESLFFDIEMNLVKVLAEMEINGFEVNPEELNILEKEFKENLEKLTLEIYEMSGEEFNIASPKQLGVILFEKLGLTVIKKTKTGYSTSVDVLEKLKSEHEIIEKIIYYRQLAKVKSTYIDGINKIINKKGNRIHSRFNQTVTVTGRISSTEPNLQNIPMKLDLGKRIRKVFVPKDNFLLIGADYSQVELRVLAHISEDENLIDAFKNNQDIHTRTASEIFNKEYNDVSSFERSSAKAVNFGIVYGISDYGLSENLNISRKKASEYINNYLEKYSKVKKYMESSVETGKKEGYVKTLLGRRRYLPDLKSNNFHKRSFAERMAMNTPIQGTAADIIKIAMVKVYNRLKEENLESKLILQVHDELIIETKKGEEDLVINILNESMESALDLKVRLKTEISRGENWYELK